MSRNKASEYPRLPDNVVPNSYLICLKPNYENFSFEGSEIIHVTVKRESREVILNATDLTVGKIMWQEDVTENKQEPYEYSLDIENELLKIIFEPPLGSLQGTLRINFSGYICTKGEKGFYRSKSVGKDGKIIYDLATSFESTNARRCFPCWDEPAIKATFEVCLILPKELTALSNMPQKITYPHRSKKHLHVVEFMRSPVMSSYLLCVCIGDFESVWKPTAENVLCRVYTDRGKKKLGKFALDLITKMLSFYNNYFGVSYSLPKLDVIALSENSSSAIEYWGLITVRDVSLLADSNSSGLSIQNLSLLMAHELSHMWIGNLVTMSWFDVLWLNEGLASFFDHLTVNHFAPQFEIWSQFIINRLIPALNMDSSRYSRAIESNVSSANDIVEFYDSITYGKGASLIRMLYHWIGEKEFREGISLYLQKYQYQSVTSPDLFRCFEQVSDKPVNAVMSSWVKQPGFPLIKVSAKQEGNYRVFTLTQERFYDDQSMKDKSKESLWLIPITFSCATKPELAQIIMEKKTMSVSILIGKSQWVNINPDLRGYYRVKYNSDCFTQFLTAVRQRQLPALERMGLLSDLFAMNLNGQTSSVELLSVLEAYIDETHYSVWKLITIIIERLSILLDTTDFHSKFMSFGRFILSNIKEKTSWNAKENEGHLVTLRRSIILSMLVFLYSDSTLTDARKRFELFNKGELDIPPDLRICVYQAVLGSGDEETIKSFMRMYRESTSLEEKDRIAKAFGSVKMDEEKIKTILEFSITEEVRTQHTVFIMAGLARSKYGKDVVWQFFKEHWNLFRHRYGGGILLNSLIKSVTENFVTDEKALEVSSFFKEYPYPGTERTVQQCVETIRLNESWLKRELSLNFISDYLSSYP